MSRRTLPAVLLDVLVFIAFLAVTWVIVGYAMDLSDGRPRNEAMDRTVIVGAIAFVFILVVWYFRSGQAKYDWQDEDDR